mgnify:FL=1|jgi:hypothetical protein
MFTTLTIAAAWFAFGHSVADIILRYRAEKRIAEFMKDIEKSE